MKAFAILLLFSVAATAIVSIAKDANTPLNTQIATPFSAIKPNTPVSNAYRILTIPNAKANQFSIIDDAGVSVLKIESDNAAGSIALPFQRDPLPAPILSWRWKINRVLSNADIDRKTADDHAARVYVFFDVPLATLSFTERTKIRLARSVAGSDIPTAALCYVWDNKAAVGETHLSPFTGRVRKIVLQSGAKNLNQWIVERRDVAADFRRAFGQEPPRIIGVAVGSDTDQTDEKVTTWFGDVTLAPSQTP
jgi:Protein of unknown function (DUF3047)